MSWTEQNTSKRPRILVFAGPNGSGKSTITKNLPITGIYVNADDIKRDAGCSDIEAAQEAERIRHALLARRRDFTFETVLSTGRNLELLAQAKAVGYQICAVYVLTNDSAVNVERVKARALAGGHDVPVDKITSRYERSLNQVARLVRIADFTRIIDNTGAEPALICEVNNESVRIWETENWRKKDLLALLSEVKAQE